MTLLGRITRRWQHDGTTAVAKLALRRAGELADSFVEDWWHGVRTARQDRLPEMLTDAPANHYYRATSYRTFRRLMRQVPLEPGRDVFVDFGSGKGRVVLLAAGYPFGRVIGVEFARPLHEQAAANLAVARQRLVCRQVELVCADARTWTIPAEANVLYFFNPFEGPVLAQVCANIRASLQSHPRPVTLIYVRPEAFFESQIDWPRWLRCRAELRGIEGRIAIYETLPSPAASPL